MVFFFFFLEREDVRDVIRSVTLRTLTSFSICGSRLLEMPFGSSPHCAMLWVCCGLPKALLTDTNRDDGGLPCVCVGRHQI